MALAVAIQMDPIDTINIDADSTFALALEAQARGHALFHYLPAALTLHDGRLYARARPLEVMRRQANHHVGAHPVKTELTARDREICAAIGPALRAQGLIFVGIDVIGDWLTEINVTSPTGIQEIARLDGIDIAPKIWDAIEARLAERANRIPA